jgi:hypothetical protein
MSSYAQADLDKLLQAKTNFGEIMTIVEEYFDQHPELKSEMDEEESLYLHWKRWEWYMSGRLGPNGEIVNVPEKLMRGLAEKEKMHQGPAERNINSGWTFVGPSSTPLQNPDASLNGMGRVNRVVFHPTNQDIIFACTPNGGLWNTLNGGTTWQNLTDYLPVIAIADFVISYNNTSIMYLLTGDGQDGWNGFGYGQRSIGILKSTDGGVSWHQTGELPDTGTSYFGYTLEQSPADPEILIAATSAGIYRTINGGTSWTKEISGYFYDIKFKPNSGSIVYATAAGHTFIRSTDGGDTWYGGTTFDINPSYCAPYGGDRMLIGVAPSNSSKVYILSAPRITAGQFCGVWLSTDNGLSFTLQSITPNVFGSNEDGSDSTDQTSYDMAITCRSDLSTTVFVAGCTVWKSIDGGANWTHSTSYNEDGMFDYIHPDVHELTYNPINNWLYAATDGGVFRSQDHGVNWTDITHDLEVGQIYHMAGWDGNINKLMIGLQDNGVKYRKDNTSAFYHLGCCDGFDVVFNPVNGEPAYASVNTGVTKYSSNGTQSSPCAISNPQYFKTLAIHNSDTSIILAGTGTGIFRSTDSGVMWTNEGATGSWSLTACPSNSTRFYASGGTNFQPGDGGLYFSGNTGDTWTLKSTNTGFPNGSLWDKITDVTVRSTNSSEVYACFGGFNEGIKIVKSTNTGDSWTNISGNLPNVPVNCLVIDNDGGIYAGTDIGVFYKSISMPEWMIWSNGLPNVPVVELVIFDDGTNKKIRAATYGRGVWQSNLASTCDAAVIVTGNLKGIRHYEASTNITGGPGFVEGGLGTFVSFQAGSYITLTEGFNVVDDSEFLGFISPCGQGGIPSFDGNDVLNRADKNSSIIFLRRMWDPETGLPFGFIQQNEIQNNVAHIKYEINKPGKIQIVAARQIQEKLDVLHSGQASSGRHEINVDISRLPHEFHYLLLFYEGKLVHFQEMDLSEVSHQSSVVNRQP